MPPVGCSRAVGGAQSSRARSRALSRPRASSPTELGLPVPTISNEIVERDYGEAEGLTDAEIRERYGDGVIPAQEPREGVAARVVPALVAIAEQHRGRRVIVVSHGGAIRSVLNAVEPDARHGSIRNGSVHSFRHTDGTLELIAFDDPIEAESLENATAELEDQNAVERRESRGSAG